MPKILSLKPMISEKAYALSQDRNTYVFGVGKAANCQQVAEAVATQFKVTVAAVRLSSTPGKKQSIISRGRRLNRVVNAERLALRARSDGRGLRQPDRLPSCRRQIPPHPKLASDTRKRHPPIERR